MAPPKTLVFKGWNCVQYTRNCAPLSSIHKRQLEFGPLKTGSLLQTRILGLSLPQSLAKQSEHADGSGNVFERVLPRVLAIKFVTKQFQCCRADENLTVSR